MGPIFPGARASMCSICQQLEVVQLSSLPRGSIFIIRHIETSSPTPIWAFNRGLPAAWKTYSAHGWIFEPSSVDCFPVDSLTLSGRVYHRTDIISVFLFWAVVFVFTRGIFVLYYLFLFYFHFVCLDLLCEKNIEKPSPTLRSLFLKVGKTSLQCLPMFVPAPLSELALTVPFLIRSFQFFL